MILSFTLTVLLAMVALASAKFWCCPGERDGERKEPIKSKRAGFNKALNSDNFAPTYLSVESINKQNFARQQATQMSSRTVSIKPKTSHESYASYVMPAIVDRAEKSVTLTASTNAATPTSSVKIMDSYKSPQTYVRPQSPTRYTENIPNTGVRSAPAMKEMKNRDEKPIPIPQAPLMSSSYQNFPSTELKNNNNYNNGLTASRANLEKVMQIPKPQVNAKPEMDDRDKTPTQRIPMPPKLPKIPTFSSVGTSSMASKPLMKAPIPFAPPMPSKMASYQKPSIGLNKEALTVGRGGLRPVQPQGLKQTQFNGTPELDNKNDQSPSKRTTYSMPTPIALSSEDLTASRSSLRPVSQITRSPVPMPKMNERSYNRLPKMQESKPVSPQVTNNNVESGVTNLVKLFENNSVKIPTPYNAITHNRRLDSIR